MKIINLLLLLSLFCVSSPVFADDDLSDEQIIMEELAVEMAAKRSYPGGIDEDDLSVQGELTYSDPHITAATLQWRTLNAINRRSASKKKSTETSED